MSKVVSFGTPNPNSLFVSLDNRFNLNGTLLHLFNLIRRSRQGDLQYTVLSAGEISQVCYAVAGQGDREGHTEVKFYIDDNRHNLFTDSNYRQSLAAGCSVYEGLTEQSTLAELTYILWTNEGMPPYMESMQNGIHLDPRRVKLSKVMKHYLQNLFELGKTTEGPVLTVFIPWAEMIESKNGFIFAIGEEGYDGDRVAFFMKMAIDPELPLDSEDNTYPMIIKLVIRRSSLELLNTAIECTE